MWVLPLSRIVPGARQFPETVFWFPLSAARTAVPKMPVYLLRIRCLSIESALLLGIETVKVILLTYL